MQRVRALIIALATVGLLALAASGYGVWRAHRWWQDTTARDTAATAEVPTIEELRGPPIPDDENAAVLYEQAWEALDLSQQDKDLLFRYEHPDAGPGYHGDGSLIPDEPVTPAALHAILARQTEALALVAEAAEVEHCRFEPPSDEDDFNAYDLRDLTRLVLLYADLRAADGDVAGALASIRRVIRAAHHLYEVPDGTYLLACRLLGETMDALDELAADGDIADAESAALRRALREVDPAASMAAALRLEQAHDLKLLDDLAAGDVEGYLVATDLGEPDSPAARNLERLVRNPIGATQMRANRAHYLRVTNEVIDLQQAPYREVNAQLDVWIQKRWDPGPLYMLAEYLTSGMSGRAERRDRALANIELCVVALDLKAHKHAQGAYPESLDDLDHPDEADYALDPFSGERLRYRREGEGFVLWSFGRDLDDDGGRSSRQTPEEQRDAQGWDMVMRCER